MNRRSLFTGPFAGALPGAAALTGALAVVHAASGDLIVPTAQDRSASTFVIVPPCGGDDFDGAEADDFGPFDVSSDALLECEIAEARANATHASSIGDTIFAAGAASSSASAGVINTTHAIAGSFFWLTFDVLEEIAFEAVIDITAVADDVGGIHPNASIELTTIAGAVVFEHSVLPVEDDVPVTISTEETGTLAAGSYYLIASCGSILDNQLPPARAASSSFHLNVSFTALCPADFDGSGAIDFGDLLSLLASWGPCAACPQDLDGNGAVAFDDLLVLLAAWGACPA